MPETKNPTAAFEPQISDEPVSTAVTTKKTKSAAKKPAGKKTAQKNSDPKPKTAGKKASKNGKASKNESAPKEKVDREMAPISPGERRTKVIKVLQKKNATSVTNALTVEQIATETGFSRFDAYGTINGTAGKAGSNPKCLLACGFVKTSKVEGVRGVSVYLTPKGQKLSDFSGVPFGE